MTGDMPGKGGEQRPRTRIEIGAEGEPLPIVPAPEEPILLRSAALLYGGQRFPIGRAGVAIGSAETAQVVLPADGVAPFHARVEPTESGHVVIDGGSQWSTYLNGDRLVKGERRPLDRGDTIAIGHNLLHYVPAGDPPRRLSPIAPVDAGRVRATSDRFTIGRDPDSDLVLDHPTVSRAHAVIRKADGRTWIEDLGSSTGVRVNGIRLRRTTLEEGDQIAIGPFRIVFDGNELIERAPARGLAVTALGVSVTIGGKTILQPTSLQLHPGELVGIIGESGAGKSTLLKILAGVTRPAAGTVLAGGEPLETRLAEVGYVPQFDIVHGALTIRESLEYSARLRLPVDLSADERSQRVREVMDELQLADRADVALGVISGGQRKRASVGTELLHQPGVLFLDEPTTGLDPGLERRLMELFRKLANNGQTVALVTHATGSISLCDRVIAMSRGGTIGYDGKPEGLLEAYQVPTYDGVYVALAEREAPAPGEQSSRALPLLLPIPSRQNKPLVQPIAYQARVLAARYATLFSRDRKHLRSALIQVPVLGLLTAFLFSHGVFAPPIPGHPESSHTGKSTQLLFLMTTVALWLGSINAAREIVKERNVLSRELAVGVRIPAYIASKVAVLFTFSAIQTVLFALIVLTIQPPHASTADELGLIIVLVIASWLAVLLGLLVSASAGTQDQASGIIPLLLVPQLLLGGAIVTLKDMSVPIRLLADLIPARWAFAAAGGSLHLQRRIDADAAFYKISRYDSHFFTITPVEYALVACVFGAAFAWALSLMIRREVVDSG